MCLYNQLFAIFHYVFKFLTTQKIFKNFKTIALVKTNFLKTPTCFGLH